MTKEEQDQLFKLLGAMLPYGVKCPVVVWDEINEEELIVAGTVYSINRDGYVKVIPDDEKFGLVTVYIDQVKIWLRPIADMTYEECDKLFEILKIDDDGKYIDYIKINGVGIIRLFTECGKDFYEIANAFDYLYSIHIDFRNLIGKGIALEAPAGMYNVKNEK